MLLQPTPTPFVNFDFSTIDWKVVIGLVAILVTSFGLFYFQWWRNRKRLSYRVLSSVLLVSSGNEIRDKLEIRYEGQPVRNVHLLVIKLINDGYVPIKKDDFEHSVKFLFPKAKILTAEKVIYHPDNLGTQIAYRDDWLEIDPALFNRKDYIQFKVLLSDYETMKIDARIVGVSVVGRDGKFAFLLPELIIIPAFLIALFLKKIPLVSWLDYIFLGAMAFAIVSRVTFHLSKKGDDK